MSDEMRGRAAGATWAKTGATGEQLAALGRERNVGVDYGCEPPIDWPAYLFARLTEHVRHPEACIDVGECRTFWAQHDPGCAEPSAGFVRGFVEGALDAAREVTR